MKQSSLFNVLSIAFIEGMPNQWYDRVISLRQEIPASIAARAKHPSLNAQTEGMFYEELANSKLLGHRVAVLVKASDDPARLDEWLEAFAPMNLTFLYAPNVE